jgi:SAM-dependent methyltransferase
VSSAPVDFSQPSSTDTITYTEMVAQTKWGSYMSGIEKAAILRGHRLAGQPGSALEVGCEGGRWSTMLNQLGWEMTCIDIDSQALNVCQARIPTAKCILTKSTDARIPCADASQKLLLCMEVPAVLPNSLWIVDEACRLLKPEGLLVGSFHNLFSARGVFHHATAYLRSKQDDYRVLYPAWRRTMQKRGFKFLYEEGLCWFPFRRASNSALVPKAIALEQRFGLRKLPSLSPFVVFIAQSSQAYPPPGSTIKHARKTSTILRSGS